jgi:hypothetical protein
MVPNDDAYQLTEGEARSVRDLTLSNKSYPAHEHQRLGLG